MKIPEIVKYLGWVLLFIFLWFRTCSSSKVEQKPIKIEIPEKKGSFKPTTIITHTVIRTPSKTDTVFEKNPLNQILLSENESLKNKFKEADSINQALMFEKQIELKTFSKTFDDENLTLNIYGIVSGEVKKITPDYVIKKQKVDVLVKEKEVVFRMLGGVELGNNTELNNFKAKGNLMFQNKKGNILSVSADNNKVFYVGYNFSIFKIKK